MSNKYPASDRRLKKIFMLIACFIMLLFIIPACDTGNGDGNGGGMPYFSNKWDELIWDRGKWG